MYVELNPSNCISHGALVHTEAQTALLSDETQQEGMLHKEPDCALAAGGCSVHRTTLDLVCRSPPRIEVVLASDRPTPSVQHYFLV